MKTYSDYRSSYFYILVNILDTPYFVKENCDFTRQQKDILKFNNHEAAEKYAKNNKLDNLSATIIECIEQ